MLGDLGSRATLGQGKQPSWMMPLCVICGAQFRPTELATPGSAWHGRDAVNLMLPGSGFLVKDLLLTIFSTLDVELCNRLRRSQNLDGKMSNSAICRACFKLAEQIDDYEARILKTKESLVYRSVRTSF